MSTIKEELTIIFEERKFRRLGSDENTTAWEQHVTECKGDSIKVIHELTKTAYLFYFNGHQYKVSYKGNKNFVERLQVARDSMNQFIDEYITQICS